jgi:hypothetical protein
MKTVVTNPQAARMKVTIHFVLLLFLSIAWLACETKTNSADPSTSESQPIAGAANISAVEIGVDQNAYDILERSLSSLSNLDQFSAKAQITYEDLLNDNMRVDLESTSEITVDRPSHVRIEHHGMQAHQILYFDGKDFTLENPVEKVYATEKLSGDLEQMFHVVRDTFGIVAPAADLLYPNSYTLLTMNVNGAKILGREMIGDIVCDHLLFTRPSVSFQIWISEEAPYLPYKYVVTDTSTSHLLSFSTLLTSWDLSPSLSAPLFKYVPGPEASKIVFMKITESMK